MERITRKNLVGYMLGDLGCGIVFGLGSNYLLLYYTDVFGITAASVATLFLIARVWDAINDPLMGAYIDYRRRTGKTKGFRPYIAKGAFPLVIFAILMFIKIPGLPDSLKLPYAYATYIGFGMLYTWVNIPYGSLVSVMTNNAEDRSKLSSFRTLGSLIGGIVMGILAMPIITGFESMQKGFIVLVVLAGAISFFSLISSAKMTEERIELKDDSKITFKDTFNAIINNRPYLALAVSSLFGLLAMLFQMSMAIYFFKDYYQTANLYSIFTLVLIFSMMIPVPFSSKLAKKYGKKNVLGFSLIISSVFYLAMFFIDLSNPAVYLGIFFLAQLSAGFGALLTYAMVADTIDYSEWKTQKRQDGVLYASYSFFRKIGQALAGWLAAMTLTWIGYKANSIQTEFTLSALRNLIVLLPGIFSLVNGLIVLIAYNLGKEKMTNVQQELELRRQN